MFIEYSEYTQCVSHTLTILSSRRAMRDNRYRFKITRRIQVNMKVILGLLSTPWYSVVSMKNQYKF